MMKMEKHPEITPEIEKAVLSAVDKMTDDLIEIVSVYRKLNLFSDLDLSDNLLHRLKLTTISNSVSFLILYVLDNLHPEDRERLKSELLKNMDKIC